MKKILSTLLAVLLLASLCSTAFADEWQEVYEENGFTLTFTDEFRNENLKGIFNHRPSGMIDDGLYYASFIYYAMSEEELNMIAEKGEDEISEADRELISSKVGTLAVVYGIDYTKISEENLETKEYLAGIAPAYQEEFQNLQAALNEALQSAEFYTPFNRGEELVGTVISFETTDLDGNPVRSEDIFKDHEVTMVNLWATWCHNCINEMTELGEMAERLAEKNVAVVGICQDADEELDTCREILKEHNVTYFNLMPFDNLDEIFGWNGSLPTSYFFDSNGTLMCPGFRGAPQTMDPYEEIINGLLSGEAVETDLPDTPHTAANDEGVYRVIVSDTDGDLVKGATVQFCSDTTCMMGKTDENGVAVFQMEEGQNYTVHILKVPEGYVKNPGEYLTDNTYCDIYIPLEKAA